MPRRLKITERFIVTVEFIDWKMLPEPTIAVFRLARMMSIPRSRLRTAVVAVDDPHLVRRQVGLVHPRVAHRLGGGHVRLFALLGRHSRLAAVEHPFQVRLFHDPRQRRDVSQLPARRVEPDARASLAERLRDFFRIFSDAGPDAIPVITTLFSMVSGI